MRIFLSFFFFFFLWWKKKIFWWKFFWGKSFWRKKNRLMKFFFHWFVWSNVRKVVCNTCNKSVSCRNLIECSLCLTMVHLKCNNLNVVDAEIIKNTGSDRFWICMFCSNNLFPFATLNDHKLYQTLSQSNNHYSDSSNSYSPIHVQH